MLAIDCEESDRGSEIVATLFEFLQRRKGFFEKPVARDNQHALILAVIYEESGLRNDYQDLTRRLPRSRPALESSSRPDHMMNCMYVLVGMNRHAIILSKSGH